MEIFCLFRKYIYFSLLSNSLPYYQETLGIPEFSTLSNFFAFSCSDYFLVPVSYAQMTASYRMNSYQVNFESIYGIEDVAMVTMFITLKNTGLCPFLSLSVIIYEYSLLDFYAYTSVTSEN